MVMDFGLARANSESIGPQAEQAEQGPRSGAVLDDKTAGRLAGTPAYMAPEQINGDELGPQTDQFAFCVSVWEGVCGQRPFEGESLAELFARTIEGRIRPVPASAKMPRWLERVLRRGLEIDAKNRWPSMAALLAVLERGRRRWRWQAALGGLGAVAVAAGTAFGRAGRPHRRGGGPRPAEGGRGSLRACACSGGDWGSSGPRPGAGPGSA